VVNEASASSLLGAVKRRVYPFGTKLVATATLVEGSLKGAEVPFRCLFVHNCNFNEHLRHRMYGGEPTVLRKRRVLIPTLRRTIQQRRGDFDLCVAVLPMFYERMLGDLCDVKGREEVRQVIDTSRGWEAMRLEFAKKKRQTTNNFAERYGLSYRMSKDPKDFDLFYHRMHVPHIKRRYGELSQINPYEELEAFFHKGVLLFVTKDDAPIAGALSVIEGKSLVFRRTGVLDGDEDAVKGGAQTALYYLQLRYAVDNGFDAVDTMKSAPYLNDGVFRHKAEWGATTLPDDEAERFVFFFTPGPPSKLAAFFQANPVVVDAAGSRLQAVVGDPRPESTPASTRNDVTKRYHTKGLSELRVYGPARRENIALADEAQTSPKGGAPSADVPD
jgi:hypothetical protein